MERLRIVLAPILLGSLYFTEVYSAQSVSTPRSSVTEKFICGECNKNFSTTGNLKRHMRELHNKKGEQFPCHQCKTRFTRKQNLTQHVQAVHKGVRPFQCTHCDKNFTRNGTLKRHRKSCSSGKDDRRFPIEGYHPPAESDRSVLVSSLTLLFQDPPLRLPAKEIESDCDSEDSVTLAELPDDFIC